MKTVGIDHFLRDTRFGAEAKYTLLTQVIQNFVEVSKDPNCDPTLNGFQYPGLGYEVVTPGKELLEAIHGLFPERAIAFITKMLPEFEDMYQRTRDKSVADPEGDLYSKVKMFPK